MQLSILKLDHYSQTRNMSVVPYQYEPVKKKIFKEKNDSSDEWEDVDEMAEEVDVNTEEIAENLKALNRVEMNISTWCKCSHCKIMPVSRECLCCVEIDEIKYKKLSEGILIVIPCISH